MKIITELQSMAQAIKPIATIALSAACSFAAPVLPYVWICTAMVVADFISARMLARRIARRYKTGRIVKVSSRRIGTAVATLIKIYAFMLLAHGVDVVIIGAESTISLLRFAAALVCFWQLWSILENESSANNARWARVAQRILIDKTERHLGVDLSSLRPDGDECDPEIEADR